MSRIEDMVKARIDGWNTLEEMKDGLKARIDARAAKGLAEYGVTVEREDYTTEDWAIELINELLDAPIYTLVLSEKLDGSPPNGGPTYKSMLDAMCNDLIGWAVYIQQLILDLRASNEHRD